MARKWLATIRVEKVTSTGVATTDQPQTLINKYTDLYLIINDQQKFADSVFWNTYARYMCLAVHVPLLA
jgi:hypothetical protein